MHRSYATVVRVMYLSIASLKVTTYKAYENRVRTVCSTVLSWLRYVVLAGFQSSCDKQFIMGGLAPSAWLHF